jgi:ACR3 family arsenite efflux pump ArsB
MLAVVSAAAGGAIGGQHTAVLGAIGGAVIGLIVMIGLAWAWQRLTSRRF